jgi:hypothetical protein
MSDAEQQPPQNPPPTFEESVGSLFLILLAVFVVPMFAFMSLRGEPHGIQIATLISYTCVVFVFTFCRARWEFTSYSLDEPYVQEQFPRLLGIHFLCSVVLYFGEGWALSMLGSLPAWWVHSSGPKDTPPFETAVTAVIGAMALSQVLISRRILARARREEQALYKSNR